MYLTAFWALTFGAAVAAVPASSSSPSSPPGKANLTATLSALNLTNFLGNITANSDVSKFYSSLKNVTIFASNNAAYSNFNHSIRNDPANATLLLGNFQYVVVNGSYNASHFVNASTLLDSQLSAAYSKHAGPTKLKVNKNGNNLTVVSAGEVSSNIVLADQAFDNGVIHVLDTLPQYPLDLATTGVFMNLSAVISLSQATFQNPATLSSNLTIFAPVNGAWDPLQRQFQNTEETAGVFSNYVLNSTVLYFDDLKNGMTAPDLNGAELLFISAANKTKVNNSPIVRPNILVDVGVVHIIEPTVLQFRRKA